MVTGTVSGKDSVRPLGCHLATELARDKVKIKRLQWHCFVTIGLDYGNNCSMPK